VEPSAFTSIRLWSPRASSGRAKSTRSRGPGSTMVVAMSDRRRGHEWPRGVRGESRDEERASSLGTSAKKRSLVDSSDLVDDDARGEVASSGRLLTFAAS